MNHGSPFFIPGVLPICFTDGPGYGPKDGVAETRKILLSVPL